MVNSMYFIFWRILRHLLKAGLYKYLWETDILLGSPTEHLSVVGEDRIFQLGVSKSSHLTGWKRGNAVWAPVMCRSFVNYFTLMNEWSTSRFENEVLHSGTTPAFYFIWFILIILFIISVPTYFYPTM